MGRKISEFWTEVIHRERQEKLELLNYVPAVLYAMVGAPETAEIEKREAFLKPFTKNVKKRVLQTAYTTEHLREKLQEQITTLKQRRDELRRLKAMNEDGFLEDWLSGKV